MTEKEIINKKILSTIDDIKNNFPELVKHLNENPNNIEFTIENGVSLQDLTDYSNSLCQLLASYKKDLKSTK
ncbi:MAG: hypothetical protein ACJAY8_000454 [Sphingobacteriales bacterium]|jgi:hypothetical protein